MFEPLLARCPGVIPHKESTVTAVRDTIRSSQDRPQRDGSMFEPRPVMNPPQPRPARDWDS